MPDRDSDLRLDPTSFARLLRVLCLAGCACALAPASCTSRKDVLPPAPVQEDLFQRAERTCEDITGKIEERRASATRKKTTEELEAIEERNRNQAVEKYRSLLARKDRLDASTREACLINVGHVIFEQCLADYRKRMREYEQAYAAYRKGEIPEEPTLPRYDFAAAREVYEEYLAAFPTSPRRPEVMYNMAFSYEEQGELDRAMALYDELALTAPASRFSPEAHMRLGEHFFELDLFDNARTYYGKVLDLGESPFYDKALFKTGWALYAKSDFAGAEAAFARLLDRQSALEGDKQKDLYNESLEILAKIQSETGGAKALESFLQRHDNPVYGLDLSLQLGSYFQETSRYEDAIDTFGNLLQRYPNSAQAPFVEQSLLESLKTEKRTSEAEQRQASLLDRYGRGTAWAEQNPDPELRKEVDHLLWTTLNNEILLHHRLAREENNPEEYEKTIALYRKSIAYFPLDENAYETRFRYAEALFESGRMEEAARQYEEVSKLEPFDKYREKAGSKRIQCLEDLRAKGQIDMDQMLTAYADYVTMNPGSEKTPLLLFKQGEILFNASRYDESAAFFLRIVQEYPDHPDALRAWVLELEALFHAGRYPELERFAGILLASSVPLTAVQRGRAEHLLRFAQFEQARTAQEAGLYAQAAARYEQLVREAPEIDIAPDALFNAAVCHKALNDWPRASACFEEITTRYPLAKHYADALLAPLPYYEETEQWDRVLSVLDKLYARDSRNELARESLFKLAKRFYRKGQADAARSAFSLYAKRYPDDVSRTLEILYLEAELEAAQGGDLAARQGYTRFLDAYEKAKKAGHTVDVDPASLAKARFMVLEPVFEQYESIRLIPPLQRNLTRKQSLLDRLVSEYLETAKSGAGPYAVAAAFRVGLAYEGFWESLLGSEIPKGMSEEEIGLYRELLEQQAAPYRQKAVDAFRITLEKAEGKGVLNPWLFRAYSHLAALDPGAYPPLLQDTVLWRESFQEKRILIWNVDLSRPRDFPGEKAAQLEQEMESILKDLQHDTLDPERDRVRIQRAVERLERLLNNEPGLYEVRFNLGVLHQMLGEARKARTDYLLALKQNPDLPIAHLNLGLLYLEEDERENAERAFTEMTRRSPDYAGSWYLLGVTLNRGASFRKAEEPLKKAIALLPQFLDPYIELGMVYQKAGEREEALKHFRRVLDDPKTNARLLRKLGWNFLETGDLQRAIDCYDRIESMNKSTYEDRNNLGLAYLRSGRLSPARVALDQARRLDPDRPEAINNLGLAYLRENDYDKASAAFEQASVLAHKYLAPVLNAAVLYGEYTEEAERAAAAVEKYLALGGTVQREMLTGWITKPLNPEAGQ